MSVSMSMRYPDLATALTSSGRSMPGLPSEGQGVMLVAVDMLDDLYREEGFAARDNMVKSIAQVLRELLDGWNGAALARISATEYALLCPTDELSQLKDLAELINSRIADLVVNPMGERGALSVVGIAGRDGRTISRPC